MTKAVKNTVVKLIIGINRKIFHEKKLFYRQIRAKILFALILMYTVVPLYQLRFTLKNLMSHSKLL